MMILLKLVLLTYIWVMGVKISTAEGMIFEKLGNYGKKKVEQGHKIWEALVVCEWCLPSVHSIVGHLFAFGLGVLPMTFNWQLLIRLPLVIAGTSLLSGLTWTIYLTINDIKENNEAQAKSFKNINISEQSERNSAG